MKKVREFDSPLQTVHMCSSKVCLVRKEPRPTGLCFESVDRSLCSFIGSTLLPSFLTLYCVGIVACSRRWCMWILLSVLLQKVWTVEFIEACESLRASDRYTDYVKAAISLPLQDFMDHLREQLRAVWRELEGADPRTHAHKLATYPAWMASPLKPSTCYIGDTEIERKTTQAATKLLTSIKEKGPLKKKSPFTRKEESSQ